jgi:hypothetical protein
MGMDRHYDSFQRTGQSVVKNSDMTSKITQSLQGKQRRRWGKIFILKNNQPDAPCCFFSTPNMKALAVHRVP